MAKKNPCRRISPKYVQVHYNCACGYNYVDQDVLYIRWADLSKAGITRKKDRSTGSPFLLQRMEAKECPGDHFDY